MSQHTSITKMSEHYFSLVSDLIFEVVPMKSLAAKLDDLPAGANVSVTCSPLHGIDTTLDIAESLLSKGCKPIPHLAARMVESEQHVDTILARLERLGIDRVFIIAGDAETPHGPYFDAVQLIGRFATSGTIGTVGFSGYPDGHPFIDNDRLREALLAKVAIVNEHGLSASVSTQMCFDVPKLVDWIRGMRANGVDLPIQLGVAGAIDRTKLFTMGMRLGIGASLRYLKKNRGGMTSLLGAKTYDPNQLLEPLLTQAPDLGIEALHVFTFNQIGATEVWRQGVLQQ